MAMAVKCELKFEFCVDFLVSASINCEFVISEETEQRDRVRRVEKRWSRSHEAQSLKYSSGWKIDFSLIFVDC
jgi:hypothetical protein